MIILQDSITWGSSPNIPLKFEYEKRRSGADMEYRVQVTVKPLASTASSFGYSIYMKLTIAGVVRTDTTIKGIDPSYWSSNIVYTSPWYTVSNKTSGTTPVSIYMYVDGNQGANTGRNQTFSYNMAIDPAASTFTAGNATLGSAHTITVTRNDTSFKHTITYSCGSATGTACSNSTATSMSWTPPLSLAAQNTSDTSVGITLTLTTYDSSGKVVGSSSSKYITASIPASVKPGAPTITLSDPTGYLSTYGGYVQSKSKISVSISASGSQGSTIIGYNVTANGTTYSKSSFTTEVLRTSGTLTVTCTVTDSRGRTNSASKSITVLAYSPPSINITSVKRNSAGTSLVVSYTSSYSSLSSKNTATYKLEYKKTGTSSWTTGTTPTSSGSVSFTADTGSSYDVRLTLTDKFTSAVSTGTGPSISTFMSWLRTKAGGIAFGEVATEEKVFSIASDWTTNLKGIVKTGMLRSISAGGITDTTNIRIIPHVEYDKILSDGAYATTPFYEALIKWICATYPSDQHTTYICRSSPNSQSLVIITIYNNGDVNSTTGLPNHSYGFMIRHGSNLYAIGTNSYSYYIYECIKNVDLSNYGDVGKIPRINSDGTFYIKDRIYLTNSNGSFIGGLRYNSAGSVDIIDGNWNYMGFMGGNQLYFKTVSSNLWIGYNGTTSGYYFGDGSGTGALGHIHAANHIEFNWTILNASFSSGYASVSVSGVTTNSKIFVYRQATNSADTSGNYSFPAAARCFSNGTVKIYLNDTTTTTCSIIILWY